MDMLTSNSIAHSVASNNVVGVAVPQEVGVLMLAEAHLYDLACGKISGTQFKLLLGKLGYVVDLRVGRDSNSLEIVCVSTGEVEIISC